MKKLCMIMLALCAISAANATTYWARLTSAGSIPACLTFYSNETCTVTASVTPTANDGNTYVIKEAASDYKISGSYTAPVGTTWVLGTQTSRPQFYTNGSQTFNFGTCTINGIYARCNGNGLTKFAGTYDVVGSSNSIEFAPVNDNNGKERGFELSGTFTSDRGVIVKFVRGWSTVLVNHSLTGTFTGYKGKFSVAAPDSATSATISLKSTSAFGDAGETMDDYLTLYKNVTLSIDPVVTQYATKGITLSLAASETAYISVDAAKPLTLIAPIYGTAGTLAKTGAGSLTIATSIETENISVNAGTLVVDSTASFAPGTTLTVSNGATVVSRVGSSIPNVTLDIKEGGAFSYDFTVPFNGTTVTTMDYTSLTAEDRAALTKPIAISLSQRIPLPQNASNTLTIARFAANAGFQADDFTDGTEKTYGLPNTILLMSEPENGIVTLTMAVKPVITRTGGDKYAPFDARYTYASINPGNPPNYTTTPVWSDGLAAHSGADYVHDNNETMISYYAWDSETRTFAGDSLYMTSMLQMKSSKIILPRTTFAGSGKLYSVPGSPSLHTYAGGPYILDADVPFYGAEENGSFYRYSIEAPLRGSGKLTLSCIGLSTKPSFVKGDNSLLKGKVVVTHDLGVPPSSTAESARLEVALGSSLGGAMDAFTADGITINKYSIVRPQQTMTLNAVNRGVTIDGYGGFEVAADQVLTIANPVALAGGSGSLIKMGAGSLKLDGAVTRSGANTIAVDEGWLTAPANDVANDADVVFAAGTGLEIDLTAVSGNGLKLTRANALSFADSRLKVRFSNAAAAEEAHTQFSVAICTVPSGSSLTADSFEYVRSCRGYNVTIRKEALDGYDRFVADCMPKGMMLIVL